MAATDFLTLVLTGSAAAGLVSYLLKDYGERADARRRQLEDLYLSSRKYFSGLHDFLLDQNAVLAGGLEFDTFKERSQRISKEVADVRDRTALGTDLYIPEARSSFEKLMATYLEATEVMKTSPLNGLSMRRTRHQMVHSELIEEFEQDRKAFSLVLSEVALSLSRALPVRFLHWVAQLPVHFCGWIKAQWKKPRLSLPAADAVFPDESPKTDSPSPPPSSPPSHAAPGPGA